jgi:hypothetical protein
LNRLVVSRKKARKRRWLRLIVVFVAVPLAVWSVVFLVWLFWPDFGGRTGPAQTSQSKKAGGMAEQKTGRSQGDQATQQSSERIPDEDRKKLDTILEQR